jgi:dinuclear metal center YbgI/SA1388 family protein
MDLSEIVTRYDERLDTDAFAELDASPNGLQVGPEQADIEHVAFAVDAVEATAETAVEAGADLLVTHHGIVWGDIERVTGSNYRRIAPLVRNDVALYVSHLPLDSHLELGNAAGVADLLDLDAREPFGELGPETVGLRGTLPDARSHADLRARLDTLAQGDQSTQVLDFGSDEIESVGIVTGAGGDWVGEAADAGLDALVTGEGKGRLYHEAREAGVSVFLAGHYATETFGVRRLQGVADDWGLETTFIEHPTGL